MIIFPKQILKENVMSFIKENFKKAAIFDDVYINMFGNIVISNLNISISGDFNDNISFIKCPSADIHLNFFKLLSKDVVIKKIILEDAEITIYKKYGKSYYETFNEIFQLDRPLSEISHIDRENFIIEIPSSVFEYREIFRNESLSIKVNNFSLKMLIHRDAVDFVISGKVLPYLHSKLSPGTINLSGKLLQKKGYFCSSSNNIVRIKGFDVRHLQPYVNEFFSESITIQGCVDADIRFASYENNLSVISNLEITNLNIDKVLEGAKHSYVVNENVNIDFLLDIIGSGKMMVKGASVYDDAVKISFAGSYIKNTNEHLCEVVYNTNVIDLEKLSEHITPFKDISLKGNLQTKGRIRLDLNSLSAKGTNFFADLKNIGIISQKNSYMREKMHIDEARVSLQDYVLNAKAKCIIERSKLEGSWNTKIKSWDPFSSETDIDIQASTCDVQHILYPVIGAIELIYDGAFRDRKFGYENIVFVNEPAGKLLNQNNVRFNFAAKELVAGHRARWDDFSLSASLKKGEFSIDAFTLAGYGAQYKLNSNAQFNIWMPNVNIEASIKGFDLKSFAADVGIKGKIEGILNTSAVFKVNAYRLSQILENTIADVTVEMNGSVIENTDLQNMFWDFVKKCGLKTAPLTQLNNISASLSFYQRADNFLTNVSLFSDKIRFTGRGRYDFFEGLDVPISMFIAAPEQYAAPFNFQCKLGGFLRKPFLIKSKTTHEKGTSSTEPLVLFDIQ